MGVCCAALKLGPYEFPNKDSAREQIRQILRETYNESMILPDSEYGQLLMHLIQQHPRAAEKIGCGVSYFTTARRYVLVWNIYPALYSALFVLL